MLRLAAVAQRLGVRWQSASGDTAFGGRVVVDFEYGFRACESGVALRFPPQSKTRSREIRRSAPMPNTPTCRWTARTSPSSTAIKMGRADRRVSNDASFGFLSQRD